MRHALLGAFANLFKPDSSSKNADGFNLVRLKVELLSGLTVALALVPEAVAFAFVAGVHPLVGLYGQLVFDRCDSEVGQTFHSNLFSMGGTNDDPDFFQRNIEFFI